MTIHVSDTRIASSIFIKQYDGTIMSIFTTYVIKYSCAFNYIESKKKKQTDQTKAIGPPPVCCRHKGQRRSFQSLVLKQLAKRYHAVEKGHN